MTLEERLIKAGLEQKEAKIYLAALELGPATVLQLSKKAAVKRPTTYVLLDRMTEQGYFAKTSKQGKVLYSAEKPEALLRALHAKEEMLQQAIPELSAIMSTASERPKITIREGRDGIEQVYAEIYENPEIKFFGSPKDIQRNFPEVLKKFEEIAKKKLTIVQDIVTTDPADLQYARKATALPYYETRLLPKGLNISIDCAIFGNKVAIFSIKKDLFVVVIESKDVADSFRALHALAWQAATPLENIP